MAPDREQGYRQRMSFTSSGISRYLATVTATVMAIVKATVMASARRFGALALLAAVLLPAAPAQADASFWMQGVQAEVRVISAFTATGETETTVPLGLESR